MSDPSANLRLRVAIRACRACPLGHTLQGPVPPALPATNPRGILIVGEAPGRTEVRYLAPFTGPAGQLLRRWLREVLIDSETVAYANTVSCWPATLPGHGNAPEQSEIEACRPNLTATIARVNPRYVLVVGGVALGAVMPGKRIGEWRGMWWQKERNARDGGPERAWWMATYHPAAILRNRGLEKIARVDIESFAFYSLGHFDPEVGVVEEKKTKGKQGKKVTYWQQERLEL